MCFHIHYLIGQSQHNKASITFQIIYMNRSKTKQDSKRSGMLKTSQQLWSAANSDTINPVFLSYLWVPMGPTGLEDPLSWGTTEGSKKGLCT